MLPPAVTTDSAALATSIIHWWTLAGVDIAVSDSPRDWLSARRPVVLPTPASTPAPVPAETSVDAAADMSVREPFAQPSTVLPSSPPFDAAMPEDLDGFMTWLANDHAQPEASFSAKRVLPVAMLQPDMLIVTDMPTQDDMGGDALFSSAETTLLSGMMRAMGIAHDQTAMASLLLARPAGGIIDDPTIRNATTRMLHFMRLIRPQAIILLGDRTSRAIATTSEPLTGLSTQAINLDYGTIPVLALPAPFVLLRHPERKAAAWAELRQLAKR